ncbi:branched-chain amino acid ABC transporter permease [Mesorhizobium microcysteis]|uniref:Branched-chain amino acid ABC transporter permease n=1 Tax=Neoaquamicrobium microcysteis TaxID=2682781 RepID=A0A5D4H4B9_9HYPH|nr:branched-chain amino acid ABC transporter permease [Mesorhizobium microcysteis]TYR35891.1 branched-chain amino acid ABC transporter permease [Mesorhizobium microcysteis]
MDLLFTQLLNGLTAGAEYALVAAGLALLFGILQIVNFAHGEFYMLAAFILYVLLAVVGLPYYAAAPLTVLLMACAGVLFYAIVISRVISRPWQIQLISTLALSIVMINLAIVLSGPTPRYVESPLNNVILDLGSVRISAQRVLVLLGTIVSFAALYLGLKYTRTGKAMRAVAQNREAAAVVGIGVPVIGLVTTVVAASFAGLAGALIAPLYAVGPTMAVLVNIKAFAAVIVGGFGNVKGAIVAAFVIGLLEAASTTLISTEYTDAIVFGGMILILLFRPNGLFGKAVRVG